MFDIEVKNASFSYEPGTPVIRGFSMDMEPGESVGLIGPNGSGKSTLLKMLCGLLGHEGEIRIKGIPLEKKNYPKIRRDMGFVFQDADNQLFMPTVFEDLAFGPGNYGMGREEAERAVDMALNRLEISHLKHRQNFKLSGGEKRMVTIASALTLNPAILLMDEPTLTLDPYNRRNLINNLNKMPETKLVASHDLDMILETCSRVIILYDGELFAQGATEEILRNRELLESCRLELPLMLQGR